MTTVCDELLLCDESVAVETPRKVAKPAAKPQATTTTTTTATTATESEGETFEVCPWDAIEMRLLREASGDYARDANYVLTIQRHGMDVLWRAKMCRWMFETAQAFKLSQDVVGCAIHYMDQYLSEHSVDKVLLQLLCLVCMYIAAKMHEVEPITMKEMELLCENKFSPDQITSMEANVLDALSWKLNAPVAFTFARDFLALINQDECEPEDLEAHVMALVQAASEEYGSVQHAPSTVGIAAVKLIARAQSLPVLEKAATKTVAQLQLSRSELSDCTAFLARLYVANFQSPLEFADLVDSVPASSSVQSTPTSSELHPRMDSPTSVEEYFESRQRKTSAALQRLIAAVDTSREEPVKDNEQSPKSAKRSRQE